MFRRRILWALLLALALLFLGGKSGTAIVAAQDGSAYEVIRLVNELRASIGLPGYEVNGALMAAAQVQASWIAATGSYTHTGEGGSTPQSRATASGYVGYATENIVGGTNLTPSQGVLWWVNSPVHYNTLVSSRYTQVGVGVAQGHGQNIFALVAGVPSNSPPPIRAETVAAVAPPLRVTPVTVAAPREDGSIVHIVQEGQALWSIAAAYEVELSNLLWYNNLSSTGLVHPGDEILVRLAEGAAPPPSPTPPLTHIVQRGETAWTIAARYNVSLGDLYWFNNLHESSILHVGDELTIRFLPGQSPPPTATPPLTYRVQSGDSAWSVAALYGLTVEALLSMNELAASAILQIGDELYIRATETPPATATAPPTTTVLPTTSPTAQSIALALATVPPRASTAATSTPTATSAPPPTPAPSGSGRLVGLGVLALALGLAVWLFFSWLAGRRSL
jgi:LysM repeat protein